MNRNKYLDFGKATLERAVKTVAQSAVALITANATGLLNVDWVQLASVSGLAGLVSVLTSVASSQFGGNGPSLTNAETLPPATPAEAAQVYRQALADDADANR